MYSSSRNVGRHFKSEEIRYRYFRGIEALRLDMVLLPFYIIVVMINKNIVNFLVWTKTGRIKFTRRVTKHLAFGNTDTVVLLATSNTVRLLKEPPSLPVLTTIKKTEILARHTTVEMIEWENPISRQCLYAWHYGPVSH
jgi:hypothetical protein